MFLVHWTLVNETPYESILVCFCCSVSLDRVSCMFADLLTNKKTKVMLVQKKKRGFIQRKLRWRTQALFLVMAYFTYSKHPQTPLYGIYKHEPSKYLQKSGNIVNLYILNFQGIKSHYLENSCDFCYLDCKFSFRKSFQKFYPDVKWVQCSCFDTNSVIISFMNWLG